MYLYTGFDGWQQAILGAISKKSFGAFYGCMKSGALMARVSVGLKVNLQDAAYCTNVRSLGRLPKT
ncbi:hypothetical protein AL073_06395 [Loktanella sp. 1ANDIMAR09]|nr:hypothetical protein AL073_06395 [Loktanella sp. 1ANDIMAR09]